MSATHSAPLWLIVEDEAMIAMLVQDAVEDIGFRAAGPAARVADALRLVSESPPEGALLDVNLGAEKVYPVADELASRNIPFAFLTGYGEGDLPPRFRDRPTVQKPFSPEEIQSAIRAMNGGMRAG